MSPHDRLQLIQQARLQYAVDSDDTIEIDETAKVAGASPDGHWVQAWVWIAADTDD